MLRSNLCFSLSALCLFLFPAAAFSQNNAGNVPATNSANGSDSSNQNQPLFPQLQGSPLGNSSLQSNPVSLGSQRSPAKTPNPVQQRQTQKTQSPASAFPKINLGAPIIGQGASAFPPTTGGYPGAQLKPMALSASASGGSGINSFAHIGNATGYSAAPTYTYPSPAKPVHAATNLRPSSLVSPTAPSAAQKVTPSYVGSNSNASPASVGIGGNPNMTPQACVATGVCK